MKVFEKAENYQKHNSSTIAELIEYPVYFSSSKSISGLDKWTALFIFAASRAQLEIEWK
jgi:hypothetical protein